MVMVAKKSANAEVVIAQLEQAIGEPNVTSNSANEALEAELFQEMVKTLAFYKAEQRGFEPGHELEDWLAAEQELRKAFSATG